MNENEKPVEGAIPQVDPPPVERPPEAPDQEIEGVLAAIDQTVDTASQDAADAAVEAEASIATLASATSNRDPEAVEAGVSYEQPAAEPVRALTTPEPAPKENGAHKQTIGERLAEDSEFDPAATNDDRVMAALAYASQLIFPLSLLMPIIILISETSKMRAFQRYHAVQSMALGIITWTLGGVYLVAWLTLGWLAWLCLCLMFPAMIALWLLPLYYAIPAYNGKRFRIPGLTQFLQDQRWL